MIDLGFLTSACLQTGAAFACLLSLRATAYAQEGPSIDLAQDKPAAEISRFEVGSQTTDIRTGCIGQKECFLPSAGLGLGGVLNVSAHFAIDANWNVTPSSSNGSNNLDGGRATEFLAGVRAEVRSRHFGYFLEAQPGVLRWDHVIESATITPSTITFTYGAENRFVSAVGAGFEYSPAARVHVRGNVSDLVEKQNEVWKNNLQPTVGVYFGVGQPMPFREPVYKPEMTHSFFDRTNVTLLIGNQLASTADSVTTYQFLQRGVQEGDPVTRPLVKYGAPGLVSFQVIETGLEIVGMYGLHRLGQHWIERALPFCVGADHAVFAYNNTKHYSR